MAESNEFRAAPVEFEQLPDEQLKEVAGGSGGFPLVGIPAPLIGIEVASKIATHLHHDSHDAPA